MSETVFDINSFENRTTYKKIQEALKELSPHQSASFLFLVIRSIVVLDRQRSNGKPNVNCLGINSVALEMKETLPERYVLSGRRLGGWGLLPSWHYFRPISLT